MRIIRTLAIAAIVLANPALAAEPEKPGAADDASNSLPSAFLFGRWGDNGDCNKDIYFRPDGTFLSYTGGEGRWWLSGGDLTMSGNGGTATVGVRILDQEHIEIRQQDGSVGTSQRC